MQFEHDGSGGTVTPAGPRATRLGEHDGSSLAAYWQLTARHETWSLPMASGVPLRHIRMAPWDCRASVFIALINCPC